MQLPSDFSTKIIWLSTHKRDQLKPGLHCRLLAVAVSLGTCLFALFCGGLLLLLAGVDRDNDGTIGPDGAIQVRAVRVTAYCLLAVGGAGGLLFGLCWLVLVRMAHCQIRDQEHQLTRDRYPFPEFDIPAVHETEIDMDLLIMNSHKTANRARELQTVSEERLVL